MDLFERLKKAEEYMDRPYNEKWTGKRLELGIAEREKYIPVLQKLFKEVEDLGQATNGKYTA